MSESQKPVDDPKRGPTQPNKPSVDQAQPYRSPVNVSEGATKAGLLTSPWMWGFAIAFVLAAGAGAALLVAVPVEEFNINRRPIEDFGGSRIPPMEEEVIEMLPPTPNVPDPGGAPQSDPSAPVVP